MLLRTVTVALLLSATAAFAESYADQNHRDYRALQEAVASGRVKAATGI